MRMILLGKAGAGKSTTAQYLVKRYDFEKYALADKLKEIAHDLFPHRGKDRALYQDLGTKMREIDLEVWIRYLYRKIEDEALPNVVIDDVRYRNEFEFFAGQGFVPVRLNCEYETRLARLKKRDGKVNVERLTHVSETELDHLTVLEIDNNGEPPDLYSQIDTWLSYFQNMVQTVKRPYKSK